MEQKVHVMYFQCNPLILFFISPSRTGSINCAKHVDSLCTQAMIRYTSCT
ncbi:hypothetical protein C4K20_2375 [Pseudomonas chlororaphis subsp. aurantiaca]|nr:hypothetical protein C4K20_2375 [Pseudomonas chlororaphis subsp. aurantiaca]